MPPTPSAKRHITQSNPKLCESYNIIDPNAMKILNKADAAKFAAPFPFPFPPPEGTAVGAGLPV